MMRCFAQQAITDSRHRPPMTTHDEHLLVFIIEQNLVEIDAEISAVTLSFRCSGIQTTYHIGPLCEK